jgi:hypothetical protein
MPTKICGFGTFSAVLQLIANCAAVPACLDIGHAHPQRPAVLGTALGLPAPNSHGGPLRGPER